MISSWVGSWLISGGAIETLLLLTSLTNHFPISNYLLAVILNTLYLFASTSWLFCLLFASACWPFIGLTCLVQYAAISSYTRARLRRTLRNVHFYRDKAALFYLPSMVIDAGLDGLVTVHGLTINLLDLSAEMHGIEVGQSMSSSVWSLLVFFLTLCLDCADNLLPGLDIGSGHKLAIHSDAITIRLFRSIIIDDVYGVHWFDGNTPETPDTVPDDEGGSAGRDQRIDSHGHESAQGVKTNLFPDRIRHTAHDEHFGDLKPSRSPARLPSPDDIEAEDRYDFVLHELRTTTRLYQSHVRVKVARRAQPNNTDKDNEDVDTRAAICADLRSTRPAMSPTDNKFTLTQLLDLFEPITRILDKVPVVLRFFLWLTSQSHPITCPSICFSASGHYLGNELTDKLFRKHAGKSDRIDKLRQQVSHWLSDADLYIDFANLRGRASVPMRAVDPIRTNLRSADIVVTRLSSSRDAENGHPSYSQHADPDTTGRVARLSGADAAFTIPVCLLPSHGYLAPPPPESSESEDTVPVGFSARASLPAYFSEPFLDFAATFSQTFQLVEIEEDEQKEDEEEAAVDEAKEETKETKETNAAEEAPGSPPPASPTSPNLNSPSSAEKSPAKFHHPHFRHFRTRLSQTSPKIASALHLHDNPAQKNQKTILQQHPILRHPKSVLQRSVKKSVVEKINGAWCAKWSNKVLRKLEDAEGDLGYSGSVRVRVVRGEAVGVVSG